MDMFLKDISWAQGLTERIGFATNITPGFVLETVRAAKSLYSHDGIPGAVARYAPGNKKSRRKEGPEADAIHLFLELRVSVPAYEKGEISGPWAGDFYVHEEKSPPLGAGNAIPVARVRARYLYEIPGSI